MNRYEVIYIIDSLVEEGPRQELIQKFNDLITSNGGTIEKVDEWGKRRLAYTIDYKNEGYYVLLHMQAAPEFPKELERNFEINDNILRYLVVKLVEKRHSVKPRPTQARPAFAPQEPGSQPVVAPTPSPMAEIPEPVAEKAADAPAEAPAPAAEPAPEAAPEAPAPAQEAPAE